MACSPPFPGPTSEELREKIANTDKRKTTGVDVVVVKAANFPMVGKLRVTKVHWGNLRHGAIIRARPETSSTCGPGAIVVGHSGLVIFNNSDFKNNPISFYGFVPKKVIDIYQEVGLLAK